MADQIKGPGDSLKIKTTGRQNKNDMVSISRMVLSIRIISKGLISFILRSSNLKDTNIIRFST
jgi:hypothetical protein